MSTPIQILKTNCAVRPSILARLLWTMSPLMALVWMVALLEPAYAKDRPFPPFGEPPKSHTVDPLPPLYADPPVPKGSQPVTITAALPGAESIEVAVSGNGCGSLSAQGVTGATLTLKGSAGASGRCLLTATFETASGAQIEEAEFEVEPSELVLPSVTVSDGFFRADRPPDETNSGADPLIADVQGPSSLTPGSKGQMTITLENPSQLPDLRSLFVQIHGAGGYDGYFEVPITRDGNAVTAEIETGSLFRPGTPVTATLEFTDNSGDYGNQVTILLPSSDTAMAEAMAAARDEYRVRGKATYEDFAQTEEGLAKTSTTLPIRFATVEVRQVFQWQITGQRLYRAGRQVRYQLQQQRKEELQGLDLDQAGRCHRDPKCL